MKIMMIINFLLDFLYSISHRSRKKYYFFSVGVLFCGRYFSLPSIIEIRCIVTKFI